MVSKKQREWAERLEREEAEEAGVVVEEVPLPFAAPVAKVVVPREKASADVRPTNILNSGAVYGEDVEVEESSSRADANATTAGTIVAPKKGFECCERCKRTIGGTVKDPVIHTSLGKHCNACCLKAHAEKAAKEAEHDEAVRSRRSEAMKARRAADGGEEVSDDDG